MEVMAAFEMQLVVVMVKVLVAVLLVFVVVAEARVVLTVVVVCIGIHGGGVSSGSWGAVMGLVAVVEPSPLHCEDSGCFSCKTKEV